MSARERRSAAEFPKDEIFVQGQATTGPNNSTVFADIDLDLEDDRIVRIIATEIFFDSTVVGGTTDIKGAASLNPDLATIGDTIAELGDDDIIHFERLEKDIMTAVGASDRWLSRYRQYPEQGFSYGQQRFRFIFFSPQNLSGGIFGGRIYYRFARIGIEEALALLRRR